MINSPKEDYSTTWGEVSEIHNFYHNQLIKRMTENNVFQTDYMIDEVVPKYSFSLKLPYIRYDGEYEEWRIGFVIKHTFNFGKKTITRRAWSWELKENQIPHEQKVIKFKRYGDLSAELNEPLDEQTKVENQN